MSCFKTLKLAINICAKNYNEFSPKNHSLHNEFEVSNMLRRYGWIVPAYTMPPDAQHVTVLRVVIRKDFSRTLTERLVTNIKQVLEELDTLPSKVTQKLTTEVDNGKAVKKS